MKFPTGMRPKAMQFLYLPVLAAPLVLSACAAPQYDAQTDQAITTLQTDTDGLIIHLVSLNQEISNLQGKTDKTSLSQLSGDRAAASYSANIATYNKLHVDFLTLRTRVDAEPNKATPHLDNALEDINQNLFGKRSLQSQHQEDAFLSTTYLQAQQGLLDAQFAALLKYELVLKTGSPTTK